MHMVFKTPTGRWLE